MRVGVIEEMRFKSMAMASEDNPPKNTNLDPQRHISWYAYTYQVGQASDILGHIALSRLVANSGIAVPGIELIAGCHWYVAGKLNEHVDFWH